MNSAHMPEITTLAKVLVVEDSLAVQRMLRTTLSEAGYLVTVAEGAAAALRVLASWSADLVIADVAVPGREGQELIGAIRENPRLKLIAMTARPGMGATGNPDAARTLRAHRLLQKPFTAEQLLACVSDCLGHGRSPAGTLFRMPA